MNSLIRQTAGLARKVPPEDVYPAGGEQEATNGRDALATSRLANAGVNVRGCTAPGAALLRQVVGGASIGDGQNCTRLRANPVHRAQYFPDTIMVRAPGSIGSAPSVSGPVNVAHSPSAQVSLQAPAPSALHTAFPIETRFRSPAPSGVRSGVKIFLPPPRLRKPDPAWGGFRLLGPCVELEPPPGTSLDALHPNAASVQAAWYFWYGALHGRPGTLLADADGFYRSLSQLGLVAPPYLPADARPFSGWLGEDANNPGSPSRHFAVDVRNVRPSPEFAADSWSPESSGRSFPLYSPAAGVMEQLLVGSTGGNILRLAHESPMGLRFWSNMGHLRNGLLTDLGTYSTLDPDAIIDPAIDRSGNARLTAFVQYAVDSLDSYNRLSIQPLESLDDADQETLFHILRNWGRPGDEVQVQVGDSVAPGQYVAMSGSSGFTMVDATTLDPRDNTHLHYFFGVDGAVQPASNRAIPGGIMVDPYGGYALHGTGPGRVEYGRVGPITAPKRLRLTAATDGIPAGREILRQHDPLYTAGRVRGFVADLSNTPLVRVGHAPGTQTLVPLSPVEDSQGAVEQPFPFHPWGPIRFNDPSADEEAVGVFRTFDEQARRPVVRLVLSEVARRPPLTWPLVPCGTEGVVLNEAAHPCYSVPDVATGPRRAFERDPSAIRARVAFGS